MRTQEEITQLKQNWFDDPCWDIETTEGFEEHKEELLQYRLTCENKWRDGRQNRIKMRAEVLNCSTELVEYIELLEWKLKDMETKIDRMYYAD